MPRSPLHIYARLLLGEASNTTYSCSAAPEECIIPTESWTEQGGSLETCYASPTEASYFDNFFLAPTNIDLEMYQFNAREYVARTQLWPNSSTLESSFADMHEQHVEVATDNDLRELSFELPTLNLSWWPANHRIRNALPIRSASYAASTLGRYRGEARGASVVSLLFDCVLMSSSAPYSFRFHFN